MIHPHTAPNLKLFRAIRKRNVPLAVQALSEGASPNALEGPAALLPNGTCSALLQASLGMAKIDKGSPELVTLLLRAGAPLFTIPHTHGRVPLFAAIAASDPAVFQAFVDHAGGLSEFLDKALLADVGNQLKRALLLAAGRSAPAKEAFFALMEKSSSSLPKSMWYPLGVSWIWAEMSQMGATSDREFLDRLAQLEPIPSPDALGMRLWLNWMSKAANYYGRHDLNESLLKRTPAGWWIRPLDILLPDPFSRSTPSRNLLEHAMGQANGNAWKIGLAAVEREPNGPAFIRQHLFALLLSAARVGSPVRMRYLLARLEKPLSPNFLGEMLAQTLSKDYDGHHRSRLIQTLLDLGADPNYADAQTGKTLLHHLAAWRRAHRGPLVDRLLELGARWDVEDHAGISALSCMKKSDAAFAAQWTGRHLEEQLAPSSPVPSPRWRL